MLLRHDISRFDIPLFLCLLVFRIYSLLNRIGVFKRLFCFSVNGARQKSGEKLIFREQTVFSLSRFGFFPGAINISRVPTKGLKNVNLAASLSKIKKNESHGVNQKILTAPNRSRRSCTFIFINGAHLPRLFQRHVINC